MKNIRIERKEVAGQKSPFVAYGFLATPKGKWAKEKIVFAYRFMTSESREEYITKFLEKIAASAKAKEERKAKKSAAQKSIVNPFKVGEMFYRSWGYEQTNINFYQVVAVGQKSVKLREVAQHMIREAGFMCEYVEPVKDAFIGKEFTKIVKVYVNYDGKASEPEIGYSKWDFRREGIYQSHYA